MLQYLQKSAFSPFVGPLLIDNLESEISN